MERHFHEQLQELKTSLLEMAGKVEESIAKSIESFIDRNDQMADVVIAMDHEINDYEILIEEKALKLLALQQPMAIDLRFIMSAIKINNDLERMGDHSVNIARYAKILNNQPSPRIQNDLPRMAAITMAMVRESINSFVIGDEKAAGEICIRDDEVDAFDDRLSRNLLATMHQDKEVITGALHFMLISKNLERIADLSTNIAEEVIFIYKARTIKHHLDSRDLDDIRSRS